MKRLFLIFMLLTVAAIAAKAQNLIAVQNGNAPKFYTSLPDAITNATAGDTVYIPGGSFDAITISKKLCLIGVGYNPDFTIATSRTMITGITLEPGADNGSITGIYTFGIIINRGSNSSTISGLTISRCYIGTMSNNVSTANEGYSTNFAIKENIIGRFLLNLGSNYSINNNIFEGSVTVNSSTIKNNVFLFNDGVNVALFTTSSIIENNIFPLSSNAVVNGDYNFFNNNVNAGINSNVLSSEIGGGNNQGSNNFLNQGALVTIFPAYDPSALNTDGIYKLDFTIPTGSPFKNAGTDGTDIGIYGGAFPWKPGSLPPNPHFQSISVAPKTDASGNLKVQITVAAQDH